MDSSSTEKTSPNLGADFEEVGKILERNDSQLDQDNRNRKISGFSINEYISRNGWKVEKLPTFEHLQISDLTQGFLNIQDKVHSEFVRQWRSVVTGDPNKRIRDSLSESKVKTKVKQVDSLSFTIGVTVTYLVQWIVLMRPAMLKHFYYASMLILLPHRFFTYRAEKAHFYMIDFCYLVNLSVILQTLFCGCEGEFCGSWFQTNYILTQGPIATAIILWANSLVFHSIDKVTSFAIHFLPALLYYLLRWETRLAGESSENTCYEYTTDLSFTTGFLQPVSFWLFWQFSYVYFQFSYLDKHPELVISQRYLVADGKKTLTKYGYKMGIHLGLFDPNHLPPDPFAKTTTMAFVIFSMVLLPATMIPPFLSYHCHSFNLVFIIVVLISALWRGATYYIHIFSLRYNTKFDTVDMKQKTDDNEKKGI